MASQANNPAAKPAARRPAPKNQQANRIKNFVDDQLKKTREQVKTIDLLHGILVIVAFVILSFLMATLVDAWIWPLSHLARWMVLGLIVLGSIGYFLVAVLPLVFKTINPDYAAKMIEDAKPGFKNSIINYVSFRKKPAELKPAIFDAVSRQAATDLTAVPGDTAVDRSKLIRIGMILCALTLFAVAYKVFSPKDPLQSFARILSPAGNLAKPAVVKITDVDPGDTKVFFGETLTIAATVKGSHVPEDVRLTYSTLDGQLVDQSVSMAPGDSPNRYVVDLSMSGGGIQQSLTYRVTARDGESPDFEAIVQPNPSIAIESLVLTPPRYTGLNERTLSGQGDIEAIEGTRVTLHGVANLPIKVAYIELLNEFGDREFKAATKPIEMRSEGKSCEGSFQVLLNSNRDRPLATHYRVKFVSEEDDRNDNANVYPIRVIPDLAPEIRIRTPATTDVQIPENGSLSIEVDANDLDFKIRTVRLLIDQQGDRIFEKELQKKSRDGNQRVTARYVVRPEQLGLKAGDKATFYATAADNRISPYSDQPDPNVSSSENYTLTVLDADPEEESKEKDGKKEDSPENSEQKENGDQQEKGESGEDGEQGDSQEKDGGESEKGSGGSESSQDSEGEESKDQQGSDGSEQESPTDGSKESSEGSEDESKGDPSESSGGDGSEQSESSEKGDQEPSESGGDQKDQNAEQGGDPSAGSQAGGEEGDSQSSEDGGADGDMASDRSEAGDQSSQSGGESGSADGLKEGDSESGPNGSGADGDGNQDKSLDRGKQERLSDNASEGEQFKKLQEELGLDDPKNEPSDKDNETGEEESGEQPDKKGKEGSAGGNQAGKDENPDGKEKNPDESSNAKQDPNGNNKNGGDSKPDQSDGGKSGDSDSEQNQKDSGNDQEQKGSGSGDQPKEENGEDGKPKKAKNGIEKDGAKNPKKQDGSQKNQPQEGNQPESGDSGQSEPKEGGQSEEQSGDQQGNQSGGEKEGGKEQQGEAQQGGKPQKSGSPSESQGQSGSQKPGQEGSEGKPGEGSEPSESQSQGGDQSENSSQSNSSSQNNSSSSKNSSAKSATGNGTPGGGGSNAMVEKEKTNQDHAQKATDMILKRLAEERHDPDPELLEKMNWDKQDLNNFLDRWKAMKDAAGKGDDVAKRKYEKALKSLGMKPEASRRKIGQSDEEIKGLNQDGAVNRPPAEYELDFNAFQRDLNRGNR